MKGIFISCFFFLFSCLFFEISAQIYVNHSANGGNNGTSWTDAYTKLQDALTNADADDEIRVAQGTYTPGDTPAATFLIDKNLHLFGGYDASTNSRDPELYETILSGDLNGDDVDDDFVNFKSDNAHTVVRITSSTTDATLLDGFTIQGGHADGVGPTDENGGGIYSDGTPTIRNCTFEQNYALVWGGGIAQFDYSGSTFILEHCHFNNNNSGETGMALVILESLFDIQACTFTGNIDLVGSPTTKTLTIGDPYGGTIRNCTFENNRSAHTPGLFVWRREPNDPGDVLVEILDCVFNNNTATGPIDNIAVANMYLVTNGTNSSYVVKRCTFNGNNSTVGGAISLNYNPVSTNASMLIDSCEFTMNTAQVNSGAIYARLGGDNLNLEIKNSHFFQNTVADSLGHGTVTLWGIVSGGNGTAVVDNCIFEENDSKRGGAILVRGAKDNIDFQVKNSVFSSNEAISGGAVEVACSSSNLQTNITIEDCAFTDNTSTTVGGALNLTEGCNIVSRISRCTITGNESPKGGAIHTQHQDGSGSTAFLENSLIANNSSDTAAIFLDSYDLTLLNNTIADNNSNSIEIANQSSLTLQNTILFNPDFTDFVDVTADNTIISNGGNLIGDGSFAAHTTGADVQNGNPLFLESGDLCDYYQLTELSPAVNGGMDWMNAPEFDLCGNNRVQDGQIDMGALESPHPTSAKEVIVGKLQLSPNPATDYLNIHFPENIYELIEISLFDPSGKMMHQQTISNGQAIDLEELSQGMYLVMARIGEKSYVGRFVKQ